MLSVALLVTPPEFAVIVAEVFALTGVVAMVKLAELAPATTVTFGGTVAIDGLLLAMLPFLNANAAGRATLQPSINMLAQGAEEPGANALAAQLKSLGGEILTSVRVQSLNDLPAARCVLFDVTPRQLLRIVGDRFRLGVQFVMPGLIEDGRRVELHAVRQMSA